MAEHDNAAVMTVGEYARHRNVDQSLISRWRSKGRLVLDADGKIMVRASDAVLAADLHPSKGGRGGSRAVADELPPASAGVAPPAAPGVSPGASGDGMTLSDAARQEKIKRGQLLQLEIAERAGRLGDIKAMDALAFTRARQALEALLAIPDRLAPTLAAETDPHKVHVMLNTELRRVAAQLAGASAPQPGAIAA